MGMMQGMAGSNTIIQTIVSEDKRGRVMSYYTMAFMGMAPFGSLLAGTMANGFGAPVPGPSSPMWWRVLAGLLANGIGAPWTVAMNGFVVLLGAGMVHNEVAQASPPHPPHLPGDGNCPVREWHSKLSLRMRVSTLSSSRAQRRTGVL